jgi:protein tyrosine phosphatase (PTP) superfamily phosphohydrolase (DUF442 family)
MLCSLSISMHAINYATVPNAHQILPGLWLGNCSAAQDAGFLATAKIGAITNATKDIPNFFERQGIEYHRLPVDDDLQPHSIQHMAEKLDDAVRFIKQHYLIDGKPVLVHCFAGMQRSAAIVTAFILKYTSETDLVKVAAFVRQKRPVAFLGMVPKTLSINFLPALKEYERRVRCLKQGAGSSKRASK